MSVSARLRFVVALFCLAPLTAPRNAGAVEGIVQISQAAVAASGFPFAISAPGRYRLVSNLVVPDANTHAITVAAIDGVEIDLNGFSIQGPNTCSYSTGTDSLNCTASGTGDGISALTATGVTVRNGIVRGMGSNGIATGARAHVESVSAFDNGASGILVGDLSLVTDCIAVRNLSHAIRVGATARAVDNVARHSGSHGVHLIGSRSSAEANVVSEVAGSGVRMGSQSTAAGNVVRDAAEGVYGEDWNTVSRNVSFQSRSIGIRVDDGNLVRENVSSTSTDIGISVGIDNMLVRNVSTVNTGSDIARDTAAGTSNHLRENYIDAASLVGGASYPGGNCCGGLSQFVSGLACSPIP